MQKSRTSVLIIETDASLIATLLKTNARLAIGSACRKSAQEGLDAHLAVNYDVILLRDNLIDGNFSDTIAEFQAVKPPPEIIIYSTQGDIDRAEHALKAGVWDYVFELDLDKVLPNVMRHAIRYRQKMTPDDRSSRLGVRSLLAQHGIIGRSTVMQNCIDLTVRIAQSEANVLIYGESGTGKELFASAIHRLSSRSRKEMTIVDCAALPPTLVESILFGHTKGSFTGANKAQHGLVEQADGGTLFLDEIGEMPLTVQKKLLRVIQERSFLPVGSTVEKKSEFRLISATNKDLDAMVQRKTFREDLLFRLRTFSLELPTLRSRGNDIIELAFYCRDQCCKNTNLKKKGLSPGYLAVLRQYDWPGNVRELFQAVERSLADAQDAPMVYPKHLPTEIRIKVTRKKLHETRQPRQPLTVPDASLVFDSTLPLKQARDQAIEAHERLYLQKLLETSNGDIKACCQKAGLSRSRLYDLMKKHQLLRKKR